MITLLCLCTHSANIFTLSYVEFRFVARLWSAEWICLARSTALRKIEQLVTLTLIMELAEWDQLTSGDVPPAATIGRSSRRSSASLFVVVSARMLKSLAAMVPPWAITWHTSRAHWHVWWWVSQRRPKIHSTTQCHHSPESSSFTFALPSSRISWEEL
jgi:hypothetical protein